MSFEKDIPEYALQPAKGPKLIDINGIYSEEEIMCPCERIASTYHLEEDLLVPDIKADMGDILFLDGECTLNPKEKEVIPKTDDLLNITGELALQILYEGIGEGDGPIGLATRIPYKYQWTLNPDSPCKVKFGCQVKSIEYEIINERKFRIIAEIIFTADLYSKKKYNFFQGISDDFLETREEKVNFTSLSWEKEDQIEIDEYFAATDREVSPSEILCQNFVVTENYKQITGEKIVINGFVYANLLYRGKKLSDDGEESLLRSHNQRVEFTQFIPIDREQRGKKWSFLDAEFYRNNLEISISVTEEKEYNFHIKGSLGSRIYLYESVSRDVVTDAYHLERNFICSFNKESVINLISLPPSETSVREIISLPNNMKVKEVNYAVGRITKLKCQCEKGRVNVEGIMECQMLWEDRDCKCHKHTEKIPFRGSLESSEIENGHHAKCTCCLKNLWCDLVNENQMEINGQILISGLISAERVLIMPKEPKFVDAPCETHYPITIAVTSENESLWDLAKRYKTTCNQIREINQCEEDPHPGERLLIVR